MSQPPQTPPPPPPSNEPGGQQWQSPSQPAGDQPPPPQQQSQSNGVAVAALVCGILALVLSWIPVINVLSVILGVVAIVTGVMGIRRASLPGLGQKGIAVGGLVTGVIAVLLSLLILIGLAGLVTDPEFRDFFEQLEEGEDPQEIIEDLERRIEEEQQP